MKQKENWAKEYIKNLPKTFAILDPDFPLYDPRTPTLYLVYLGYIAGFNKAKSLNEADGSGEDEV